jgi:sirohydrochlorin cobaltochelatase
VRSYNRPARRAARLAVILVGHGSKARGFDRAMKRVAGRLRKGVPGPVRCAYLEINAPSIAQAVRRSVRGGAREVRILPYFLLTGNHVQKDIPRIVRQARREHGSKARIRLCPYLGYDERIVAVVKDRLRRG